MNGNWAKESCFPFSNRGLSIKNKVTYVLNPFPFGCYAEWFTIMNGSLILDIL